MLRAVFWLIVRFYASIKISNSSKMKKIIWNESCVPVG